MKLSNKLYGKLFLGFLLILALSSVLPPEFVIATLLFIAVTYGGVTVIKWATSYDLKIKREHKT